MLDGKLWTLFLGLGGALYLGLHVLFSPLPVWISLTFLLGTGCLGVVWLLPQFQEESVLTVEAIEARGLGKIVARLPETSEEVPDIPEDWNESVAPSRHTRMERPRFFLPPPLTAQEMVNLLAQAIQLSQRALQAAAQHRVDQPLLLATHRGKGARAKVEKVTLSLAIWGWTSWANHIRGLPAPEPLSEGGYSGKPEFLDAARQLQQALQEHPLQDNPFTVLQITQALDRKELNMLLERPLSPSQQEMVARLETLLQEGEKRLQQLLSPNV